jgi:hypothetical protein
MIITYKIYYLLKKSMDDYTTDNGISKSKSESDLELEPKPENLKCRTCGKQFDDLADMQKHTLIEHLQRGDIPKEK